MAYDIRVDDVYFNHVGVLKYIFSYGGEVVYFLHAKWQIQKQSIMIHPKKLF